MAPEVEHLLDGVKRGDLAAFEGLVRALTLPIYGYVAGIVRDDGAAQEITQDTLIRVYRRRDGLNHGGTLRGYCYRIATNLALDHIRSRRVRRQREQEAASMNPSAHDPREQDLGRDAWRLVEELPQEERATLHLRYGQGLTIAETAQALGVPEGTVSTRQRSALQKLRERLALSIALIPPAGGLEGAMLQAAPSQTVSAATIRSMEALIMASIGTKAATNTAILVIAAILLSLGGIGMAVVVWPASPPPPMIASPPPPHIEERTEVETPDQPANAPARPERAGRSQPTPDEPAEEPTDNTDLLRELLNRYQAQDRPGFAEAEAQVRAAQPWDLEALLPFFTEVIHVELKRWPVLLPDESGQIRSVYGLPDYKLEIVLIDLTFNAIQHSDDPSQAYQKVQSWLIATAASEYPLERDARQYGTSSQSFNEPRNYDANALGLAAVRFLQARGFEHSHTLIETMFAHTAIAHAMRHAGIQIALCDALGEGKVSAAVELLERLYLRAAHRAVKAAAFRALHAIEGDEYVRRESLVLREMARERDPRRRDEFSDRFAVWIALSPSGELMLNELEALYRENEASPMHLNAGILDAFHWRAYYRRESGVDESVLLLNRLAQTSQYNLVEALHSAVSRAYRGTNDSYAKQVYAEKLGSFKELGWTEFRHQLALGNMINGYCGISGDPAECLEMFIEVWYPAHRDWALEVLDRQFTFLFRNHLNKAHSWSATHERAQRVLFERIEGNGEFGYSSRTTQTDHMKEALTALHWIQTRQALEERTQTANETLRAFYEEALAEWIKKNG